MEFILNESITFPTCLQQIEFEMKGNTPECNIKSCKHRRQEHRWEEKTNLFLLEFMALKNMASWTK